MTFGVAGLAHDRSPPRERQARSSVARLCAPRPLMPLEVTQPEGLRGLFATERRWSRKSLAGPEHVLKFWPV